MDEPTHSNATENKEDDCQKAERKMSMKNRMKKVSALVLAATMAMGSYTSAFAADMTVYLRTRGKEATVQEGSFVVHDVDSSMSIYQALEATKKDKDMLDDGVTLGSEWSKVVNKDNTVDYYLTSLTAKIGNHTPISHTNNGGNTKLYKDDKGNYIGGYYEGNSWMWCMADATSYPEDITLSDQKCKNVDFAIILSYDYSAFPWGDTTGTPEP